MTSIKSYLKIRTRTVGIECCFGNEANMYKAVLVTRTNNLIVSVEAIMQSPSLKSISDKIKTYGPLQLVFSGNGILCKTIICQGTEEDEITQLAFPAFDKEMVYSWVSTDSAGSKIVTVVKRTRVDEVIDQFLELGLVMRTINIVPNLFIGQLNRTDKSEIITNGFIINGSGTNHERVEKTDKTCDLVPLTIGSLKLSVDYYVAFVSAVSINSSLLHDKAKGIFEKYNGIQKLKQIGIGSLAAVLLILIVNFFLWDSYAQENEYLKLELSRMQMELRKGGSILSDLSLSKELYGKTTLSGLSKVSWYSDKIAASRNSNIRFTELIFFPEDNKKRESNRLNDIVIVNGQAISGESVAQWVMDLGNLDWTDNVEISKLSAERRIGGFAFSIRIQISNNNNALTKSDNYG